MEGAAMKGDSTQAGVARGDVEGSGDAASDGSTQARVPFSAWLVLALLMGYNVIATIDARILLLLVDPIKADLHLSDFQMSLLLGPAFVLCYMAFGIPFGWAADRYPRRWVIYFGVTFWSIFTMLSAYTRTFAGLVLARAAVGVGESSLTPASYALLTDKFPRRLSIALAAISFAPRIGYSVALIVGGALIALSTSLTATSLPFIGGLAPWRICFVLVGAPGLVLALLALLITEPKRGSASAARPDDEKPASLVAFLGANWTAVVPLALGFGLASVAGGGVISWVPTYVQRQFHFSAAQTGGVIGLVSFASIAVLLLKALLVDWMYASGWKDIYVRFYVWVLLAATPLAVIAFQMRNPIVFLVMVGTLQSTAFSYAMFQGLTAEAIVPRDLRGRMAAFFIVITHAAFGLGPMLPALLSDRVTHSLGPALMISTTAMLLGATGLLWLGMRGLAPMIARQQAATS
jgi:MFS family permease